MSLWQDPFIRRIFGPMLAGVLALFAMVGVSLWLTYRTAENVDDVLRERRTRELSTNLFDLLQDMEIGHRGHLLTRDRRFFEPYETARPKVDEALTRLKNALAGDQAMSEFADRISAGVAAKRQAMVETLDLESARNYDPSRDIAPLERGKQAMDDVRATLGTLIGISSGRIADRLSALQTNSTLLMWVIVSACLLIVLVIGAAIWIAVQHMRGLLEARGAIETANASLEERVKERTLDLSRANEEIQRYAYIVTHDLRAPLVNIVGFTSELEAGLKTVQEYVAATANASSETKEMPAQAPGPAEVRSAIDQDMPEAIGFIRASTTKMDKLINAILKLSREGRRQLRPERIDLKAMIEGTVASVQHQIEEKNIQVEVDGRLPVITSDRLALEQVFGNLIDNAIKYLSPGRPGEIRISGIEYPGAVLTEVADNGRGIAPADHQRIFDLFRRSGSQTIDGEGIGLAHVRTLVRRLGGDITVESEIGRGSKFKVRLPKFLAYTTESKEA